MTRISSTAKTGKRGAWARTAILALLVGGAAAAFLLARHGIAPPSEAPRYPLRTNGIWWSTATVVRTNRLVFVSGEVFKPGEVEYRDQMRVFQAIELAGGFTSYAAKKSIKIQHEGGDSVLANPDDTLRPGDVVRVARRWL